MQRRAVYGWYVLGLLAFANFLHYGLRNVVVTMYDELRGAFALSDGELGLLTTAFMVTHGPATVLMGWWGDRRDRRLLIAAGVVLWSFSALLAAIVETRWGLLGTRAAIGFGTAACVPVANAFICDYVPVQKKARAVAVFNLGLFLGGVSGPVLGEELGYPEAFYILGVPGLVIGALIALLRLPEKPRRAPETASEPLLHSLRALAANPTYRWTLIGAIAMAFAAGAYLAWFFELLEVVKGASKNQALTVLALSMVTGLGGVMAGGAIGDRLHARGEAGRQLTIALGIVLSVPTAALVIYLPLGGPFYLACLCFMFTISWYHGPLAASVDDLVPAGRAALAQGAYIACMHLFGTALGAWTVGLLRQCTDLSTALLAPTAVMALGAWCFVSAAKSASLKRVVQP